MKRSVFVQQVRWTRQRVRRRSVRSSPSSRSAWRGSGFRILSPEEQLERERVQAEQRPSGQFAADMEERMAVLKAAGVTSAPDSAAMARTNSV